MQPCREKRSALCLALVLIAAEAGVAEQAKLGFRRAVRAALSRSPEIDYHEALVRILSEQLSPMISERIPVLSLSYSGNSEYTEGEPLTPLHRIDVGAEIELFDGGRTSLRTRLQEQQAQKQESRLKEMRAELKAHIVELYLGVLLAEREVKVREESYESAYRYLRIARTRLKRGTIIPNSLSETVIELERLGIALRRSKLSRSRYRSSLSELTGIEEPQLTGELPDDYRSIVEEAETSLQQLIDAASSYSSEIRSSRQRVRAARIASMESQRRHLPSLHLFSSIGFEGETFPPVNPEVTIGIRIATPVRGASVSYTGAASAQHYGRGGYDSITAEFPLYREYIDGAVAKIDLERKRIEYGRTEVGLKRETREQYEELELLQRELDLAHGTAAHREDALRRSRLLFEEGEESLSSLFEAILTLTEARLSCREALSRLFLSEYELLSSCGMEEMAYERAIGFFSPAARPPFGAPRESVPGEGAPGEGSNGGGGHGKNSDGGGAP